MVHYMKIFLQIRPQFGTTSVLRVALAVFPQDRVFRPNSTCLYIAFVFSQCFKRLLIRADGLPQEPIPSQSLIDSNSNFDATLMKVNFSVFLRFKRARIRVLSCS